MNTSLALERKHSISEKYCHIYKEMFEWIVRFILIRVASVVTRFDPEYHDDCLLVCDIQEVGFGSQTHGAWRRSSVCRARAWLEGIA